ncbi:MAG: hypothetical protein U0169_19720 [Polyangiaceae bacterium]
MKSLVKLGTLGTLLLVAACSSTTSTTTTSTSDGGADDKGGNNGVVPTKPSETDAGLPPKKDSGAATTTPDAGKPEETCSVENNINFGDPECNTCAAANCCTEINECSGKDVLEGNSSPCLDFGACVAAAIEKLDGGQPTQAEVQKIVQDCEAAHTGGGQPYIAMVQCLTAPACKADCGG